jgi:hypothetical protein
MVDSDEREVVRLRRLRHVALKARAMAAALEPHPARRNSLLSRSASSCWRIARVATGTLRAHPYVSYQQGPGVLRGIYVHVSAGIAGAIARHRGVSMRAFHAQLQRVARELDDTRALTRSAELSDTLGRSQTQTRRLLGELRAAARHEAGLHHESVPAAEAGSGAQRDAAGSVAGSWPYLAL